ncbi:hypothetical protein V6C03_14820 [Methyloligella sp. 2.7D]|uniref:hypothetical protein n=1 Tax=unclassified Methyloligella TaxID=2625955 RepID=UPI00157C790E|nr:hypothetical protein [Methyloligella sp. GL2]QKP76983.1 hypothetical protein HT051_05645 [Methyloligella sp. GL2]
MNDQISAARRRAELQLARTRRREAEVKTEQEQERDALQEKTARLRALRLAKEAAETAASEEAPKKRVRRS